MLWLPWAERVSLSPSQSLFYFRLRIIARAGKSTTINMLCGYLTPSAGEVIIHGRDIRTELDLIHLDMGKFPYAHHLTPAKLNFLPL